MFKPTKSIGEPIIFSSSAVYLGAFTPAYSRNAWVYFPSRVTLRKPAFSSRVAIAYPLRHVARIMRKGLGSLAGLPTAKPVLKRLRQIPMIERRVRFDAVD